MQTQLDETERELKIRDYSRETVKSYLYGLREYFTFKKEEFETLNQGNRRDFLMLCGTKVKNSDLKPKLAGVLGQSARFPDWRRERDSNPRPR